MKKGRLIKGLGIACVIVVGGVWIAASRLGLTSSSDKLARQLALAKQDGLPLTSDDLRSAPVDNDQNSAQIFANAEIQALMLPGKPRRVLSDWIYGSYKTVYSSGKSTKSPTTDADAAKALDELAPVLKVVDEGSRRPHFAPQMTWNIWTGEDYKSYERVKGFGRLFVDRAILNRKHGRYGIALQSLTSAARLARLLGEVPEQIAAQMRMNLEAMVYAEASNVLRADHSGSILRAVVDMVRQMGDPPNLQAIQKGEFVEMRMAIPQMANAQEQAEKEASHGGARIDDTFYPVEWRLLRIKSIRDLNEANAIARFRSQYVLVPGNPARINTAYFALKRLDDTFERSSLVADIAADAVVPTIAYHMTAVLNCMARRRLLLAACAIFESASASHRFPSEWAVKGLDGLDPFTDKTLSYKQTPNGFVVYSFGEDRLDDGGRPYQLTVNSVNRSDISFEYPTLSVRRPGPAPSSVAD